MENFVAYEEWLEQQDWIAQGDCIYVVSDMLELAKDYRQKDVKLELDNIIDGLQRLVGREGTLLFPTFNWDFCKGIEFDYYKTLGRTGALSKAAMKRKDFRRTYHPIYSFAVWGAKQEMLLQDRSVDSFGPGTIFEKLMEWDAKVLVIGLTPLQGVTYIHHVEQMVGVPYRYHKEFSGDYIDENGIRSRRTYRMYVRDLDMDPQYINGFQLLSEQMIDQGLVLTARYSDMVPCHLLRIADLDGVVRKDIIENDSGCMYEYRHITMNDRKDLS